jgi:hypothetical protein
MECVFENAVRYERDERYYPRCVRTYPRHEAGNVCLDNQVGLRRDVLQERKWPIDGGTRLPVDVYQFFDANTSRSSNDSVICLEIAP